MSESDVNAQRDIETFEDGTEHWQECHGFLDENGRLILICYCGFFNWYDPKRVVGRKVHVATNCHLEKTQGNRIKIVCYCPRSHQKGMR